MIKDELPIFKTHIECVPTMPPDASYDIEVPPSFNIPHTHLTFALSVSRISANLNPDGMTRTWR